MLIQTFFVPGISHLSYLLCGSQTCAVIDPKRDIQDYLDISKELGFKITHILETHLHADFISGHLELAEKTGVKIYAPRSGNCQFQHVPLSEGDILGIEDMEIKILETPGHTPEHIVYVVIDHSRGDEPAALFSGDTLFVGDVGRPDLFPNRSKELGLKLFESLRKLTNLTDFCEIYPAHGAGSFCGRALSAKRTSTIGYEKRYNYALKIKNKEEFVKSLTTEMPEVPDHFSRCSEINRIGPSLIKDLPKLTPYDPLSFYQKTKEEKTIVLDIRPYEAFGGIHVPGAFHIDFRSNFSTFAGWILSPEKEILLVSENALQSKEAAIQLHRVGLDRVIGFLDGGMNEWVKAGLPFNHICQISATELNRRMKEGPSITLLDVRTEKEFKRGHIDGAINIPFPDLRFRWKELDSNAPIVILCNSGQRSSLGASILQQKGFKDVTNFAGGMMAYNAAGFGPECPFCEAPHNPSLNPHQIWTSFEYKNGGQR
jgi:glyoxylase-like metal-dependent hydrolase (beta-lactamase superfamily II)/rhodanese-related sulfurtransferase